jgi:predicted 2-oxoglutarate/Fe(II)-dependent dioxygenase YbiX
MDSDQALSCLFGAVPDAADSEGEGGADDGEVAFQPLTVLLDQNQRVLATHKIDEPEKHPIALAQFLGALPTFGPPRLAGLQAPVIFVPMAFESEFCQRMIAHFEETGGKPSGILEDVDGQTLLTFDPERKRRSDLALTDKALQQAAHARIARRVAPEIKKAFQLDVTRLERSVITRYQAGDFHARHRDNDALGTAHRMFSITIPLNAEGYTGGHLRIPEFGPQIYQIPTGCAMVHSCGLLHEITPVQEGTRYAYIPIVYNETAAQLREQNKEYLGEGVSADRRETQD